MSVTDKMMEISEAELQAYIDSESREAELEAENEMYKESDFDDEIIKDEPITISEILNSATLKLELCQHIGASNWRRWKQLNAAQEAWDEVGV